jgi:aryl-alcohol dehydrogenase-like predicted oxidoreductase
MQYRQLGYSGLRVSVIGLGTNQFAARSSGRRREIIAGAIDLG